MRGHVRKRGNTWSIVFDEGYDENGKRRQRWRSGFATKREAERVLADTLGKLDRGEYVKPSRETVGAYLGEWIVAAKPTVRATTWESYRMLVESYVKPRIGTVPLQRLTPGRLNALYAQLLESGRLQGKGGGLSPRTVRYVHAVLRRALGDAVRENMIVRNPADAAKPPKPTKAAPKAWTAEELRRFLEHVRADRLCPAYHLAALTGMRRGEVLGLRWSDLDLDGGRLHVRHTITSPTYKTVSTSAPKTDRGRRMVALDPATVKVLRDHQARQLDERVTAGDAWGNVLDLVFTDALGRPVHPQALTEAFERHVKAAKLPRITLHGLRHTHATLALGAGLNPKVVSERLGHASTAFTMDVYADSLPVLQESAAALVAGLVLEPR